MGTMKRSLISLALIALVLSPMAHAQAKRTTNTFSLTTTDAGGCATGTTACALVQVDGYMAVSVQLTAVASGGTVQFEATNELAPSGGTIWVPQLLTPTNSSVASTSATAAGMWQGQVQAQWFRVRQSAYSSGTTAGVAIAMVGTVTQPSRSLGATTIQTISQPAAGVELLKVVPAGQYWTLASFGSLYTASAAVATRTPTLIIDDGANVLARIPAGGVGVTASQAPSVSWANYGVTISSTGVAYISTLPTGIVLQPGWRIRTLTNLMDTADQWSPANIVAMVSLYPSTPTPLLLAPSATTSNRAARAVM